MLDDAIHKRNPIPKLTAPLGPPAATIQEATPVAEGFTHCTIPCVEPESAGRNHSPRTEARIFRNHDSAIRNQKHRTKY